jgi:hypothetical protein
MEVPLTAIIAGSESNFEGAVLEGYDDAREIPLSA